MHHLADRFECPLLDESQAPRIVCARQRTHYIHRIRIQVRGPHLVHLHADLPAPLVVHRPEDVGDDAVVHHECQVRLLPEEAPGEVRQDLPADRRVARVGKGVLPQRRHGPLDVVEAPQVVRQGLGAADGGKEALGCHLHLFRVMGVAEHLHHLSEALVLHGLLGPVAVVLEEAYRCYHPGFGGSVRADGMEHGLDGQRRYRAGGLLAVSPHAHQELEAVELQRLIGRVLSHLADHNLVRPIRNQASYEHVVREHHRVHVVAGLRHLQPSRIPNGIRQVRLGCLH
mmetsp:Transcript_102853/g.291259  ORF Transcript_102853/g.291259 Transcript_102853/m.291259 type:complete len:285 (-) Transcript_102853:302-1156(-)